MADLARTSCTENERIAARKNDFPDFGVRFNVGERGFESQRRQRGFAFRSHHFAAKAKTAIDRTGMDQFEQHAIPVTMNNTGNRRMRLVADGIGALFGCGLKFGFAGDKLACNAT